MVDAEHPVRQRSRRACIPCRQRKRKCNNQFPCSTCSGYGYPCSYNEGTVGIRPQSRASTTDLAAKPQDIESRASPGAEASLGQHGILDPVKSRYMGEYSSIAFPWSVGRNLQLEEPPRLHSYAYHNGLRPEPDYAVESQLMTLISWEEVRDLLETYKLIIHPVFCFLDVELVSQTSEMYWKGNSHLPGYEALIGGVIALSSLFSGFLNQETEAKIVQHSKNILEDPFCSRLPSVENVAAWILRTLYLRSTTRPHMAWLSSCTTMHLVEATGLHRDVKDGTLTTSRRGASLESTSDNRARLAMVSRCLNIIISYEYGRSAVTIDSMSRTSLDVRPGDFTAQLYRLAEALPIDSGNNDPSITRTALIMALKNVSTAVAGHDFIILTKADLCFSIYRRLRLLDPGLKPDQLDGVLAAGQHALPAARSLMERRHPWWNLIGTVFQFVCVLLAIDTSDSLSKIPEAMETLETIVQHLNTNMAHEALDTARVLIRAAKEKRNREITILDGVRGLTAPDDAFSVPRLQEFGDIDWNVFFQSSSSDQYWNADLQ